MNHDITIPLLRFLGVCMYGDAAVYYVGLSKSERALLESQARASGMTAWLYRYLSDVLPAEKRAEYQNDYRTRQVRAIAEKHGLDRLCRVLGENGLRFVPVKGADLAYRAYPDAALRMFCDWDIWFHPDDCGRALEVLAADGWRIPKRYTDSRDTVMKTSLHHYSPHVRDGHAMEPHFTLPNFGETDPHVLWEETVEIPGESGRRVLSPELNLLMLARHASGETYMHASLPNLLTDAAAVMKKEPMDFARLRALSNRLLLPYPGDLFAAFPEFFPPDAIAGFGADPERASLYRTVFEKRSELKDPDSVALLLARFAVRGRVMSGIRGYILKCSPNRMRTIFHLPKHGAWGRVAWAYVRYFCNRTWRASTVRFRRDRGKLMEYARTVESLESCAGIGKAGKKA